MVVRLIRYMMCLSGGMMRFVRVFRCWPADPLRQQ
jgi:hypothetical protein